MPLTNFRKELLMITLREIADDESTISSTRWAFATVIKFDIVIILVAIIVYLVGHFIGKPLDGSFFSYVATLLGILTSIVTASKALQGFETKKYDMPSKELNSPELNDDEFLKRSVPPQDQKAK